MDCPTIPTIEYGTFSQRVRTALAGARFPISGTFELNLRCNMRCKHCYVSVGHMGIPGKQELTLTEIKRIVDEIVDEGCLWLLLTGGEPLVRKDFKDIYRYVKQKGLLVTLFTNGTLITERMADFLQEYPPFNLEITLYGMTQETYERVTGIPGSHRRCMQGIARLKERGIQFGLKTMLLTLNAHELAAMQEFAASLNVKFRYDGLLNSGIEGCGKPASYRLPIDELVAIESKDDARVIGYQQLFDRFIGQKPGPNDLYICSAGLKSFHIDPYGELSLCMMARHSSYSLRSGSFKEGWNTFLSAERRKPAPPEYTCSQCEYLSFCSQCPGWSYMENGREDRRVDYLCQVSKMRIKTFGLQ